jgi:hypothetical protein
MQIKINPKKKKSKKIWKSKFFLTNLIKGMMFTVDPKKNVFFLFNFF